MSEEEEKIRLERKLESFFHGLNAGLKVFSEVREAYNESMAFEFNSLNFLRPNENKISEIIAFFLDPHEVHGQKNSFLRIFLNTVLADPNKTEILLSKTISVKTQDYTDKGRPIDIVIQFGDNDYLIGIENKVWNAPDQSEQVYDYAVYLKKRSNGKYLLLYLSPRGENPGEGSITKAQIEELGESFKTFPFNSQDTQNSIITLFREFEKVCMADNVRAFLKDFIKYLITNFIPGENIMGENEFITNFMLKNNENMELALKIIYNDSELKIKKILFERLKKEIEDFSNKNKLISTIGDIDRLRYEKDGEDVFIFTKDGWNEKTYIFWTFENTQLKNCYYGMCHDRQEFLTKMKENYNFQCQCSVHCNSYYSEYQNWDCTQPWLDIITLNEDGKSKFLTNLFDKVLAVLNCAEQTAKETEIKL